MACSKHPNPDRLPGVCSFCLRERLHQLVLSRIDMAAASAFTAQKLHLIKSPSYTTTASSFRCYDSLPDDGGSFSGSRRTNGQDRRRRNGSAAADGGPALSLSVSVGGSLRKSRSVAVIAGVTHDGEREEAGVKTVKRGGFWSKLIRLRSGRSKEKESWSSHHHRSSATLREIFMY
ncbi:hypothetical protein SAY87_026855 [Trapa incisa]|uniref:Uncharacterized protein n=2 Tax=Trapa TaxID=22665 RepID=A0AAN7MII8_TRANT|nr:hypothetical protein SAY87_026855 [Trapa incisa]KAK4799837.1 hypothetical protein SAY86_025202 [Trapa natans]